MWDKLAYNLTSTIITPQGPSHASPMWDRLAYNLTSTLIFTAVGLVFFAVAFVIISRVSPFSLRKEIEEDQNTALAIIIGSVILGIAIIVAAAIHG